MLVLIKQDYTALSLEAAQIVASAIRANPNLVLGLATGSTPLGMYQELVRLHREEGLDFSRVITFNLDEYVGFAPDHPQSYHSYMHRHFFSHVNIDSANIHIPDGLAQDDYERHCAHYEERIGQAGGIDLQLLGIGRDGHIGFNEPTSSLASRTRVKTLTRQTVEDNARAFGPGEEIPQCAITMGIGTILEAKRIVLLASGAQKAHALAKAIEGPITAAVTASALQLHRDVTAIVDEAAATELQQKEYYHRVAEMTRNVTPGRAPAQRRQ